MIVLKGKYNIAKVYTDEIEKETETQIRSFLNHPAFKDSNIVIMPDCHYGEGACIGLTMTLEKYLIPNLVGVDIGCGVSSYCLGVVDIEYKKLDKFIRKHIPTGFKAREDAEVTKVLEESFVDEIEEICTETEQDETRVIRSLGSLGGGNHFIEINEDDDKLKWLTIHTGSRGFGHSIAKWHQKRAKDNMATYFIDKNKFKNLEFLVLNEEKEDQYLEHMDIAQQYASKNRELIASIIIQGYFKFVMARYNSGINFVESVHNYIDTTTYIVRKGAISAGLSEDCIIPLNMRDGIIMGLGRGNPEWNFSAPHGAGRLLSRKEARQNIKLEDYKETMKEVWSSCVNENTLDEAPMAYKDKDKMIKIIEETVEVNFMMKTLYNFKDDTKKGK